MLSEKGIEHHHKNKAHHHLGTPQHHPIEVSEDSDEYEMEETTHPHRRPLGQEPPETLPTSSEQSCHESASNPHN
jgi:hypothetical protein